MGLDSFLIAVSLLFRAHEHWNLPEPPSIVAFAKKMLVGGYYFRDDFLPKQVNCISHSPYVAPLSLFG